MTDHVQETPPPAEPSGPPPKRMLPSGFSTLRDLITFFAGFAFVCNEVFISEQVEPPIIALGAAMMGLPLVLGADERKRGGRGDSA